MYTVFESWDEKNELYNRLFDVLGTQKDADVYAKFGRAFDEIRRANRNWDMLVAKYITRS